MLCVLIEILCFDRIAAQERGLCECQITFVLPFGPGGTVVASALLNGRAA